MPGNGPYLPDDADAERPRAPWILGIMLIALVAVIGLAGILQSSREAPVSHQTLHNGEPIPPVLWDRLTTIPAVANAGGSLFIVRPQVLSPPALGAPTVVYIGGEFCPYCAARRWPLVIALSHFGRLLGVEAMHSDNNPEELYRDIPTVTFVHARYQSRLISVRLVENWNRQGQILDPLTAEEAHLLDSYDTPPYVRGSAQIPFLLIGGRYLFIGSPYLPTLLERKRLSNVVAAIRNPLNPLGREVLSSANEFSAAICLADGNKPRAVCSEPFIEAAKVELLASSP